MSKQKRRSYTVTVGNMNGSTWTHKLFGKTAMLNKVREEVDDRTTTFCLVTYLGKLSEEELHHGNGK